MTDICTPLLNTFEAKFDLIKEHLSVKGVLSSFPLRILLALGINATDIPNVGDTATDSGSGHPSPCFLKLS